MFPKWQNKLKDITEIDELEMFKTDVQVTMETTYNFLWEITKKHNTYLREIEYSERIAINGLKKTKKLIEIKEQELQNKIVKVFIKRKLQSLNGEVKIYQNLVMEQQKIKSDYYKETRQIQKFRQELQQKLEILKLQIEDKKQRLSEESSSFTNSFMINR